MLLKAILAPPIAVGYYVCIIMPIEAIRRRMSPNSRFAWLFRERPH